jgi:iron complex transport system ATP-binding protein
MAQQNTQIILYTEDLTVGYHSKKTSKIVAENIQMQLKKGTFISLLGKNGIGKSTLLRTLSNVQKPLKGSVFIDQKDIKQYSNQQLASFISLVLTERLPESQLTVFELVALGRQPHTNWVDNLTAFDIEKIETAMLLTEVLHLSEQRYYELSDGQLQRVLIARALAQDTPLIILDEPTAHLDLHHTLQIFKVLKKLVAETSKTILISTHEVNLAIKFSDEIALMTENSFHKDTPEQLIENNLFDALFSDEMIRFDKNLQQFVMK